MAAAAAGRVHVLGCGAVGTLLAHHLASAGVPVTVLLRSPAQLAELGQRNGRVELAPPPLPPLPPVGGEAPGGAAAAAAAAARTSVVSGELAAGAGHRGPIPRLLVTTKASQALTALSAVRHRLTSDSVVVLLLNGVLGVYTQAVAELWPDAASRPGLLLGSTTHGCYRQGPFRVVHASAGAGACVLGRPTDELQAAAEGAALQHAATGGSRPVRPAPATGMEPPGPLHQHQQQHQEQQQQHQEQQPQQQQEQEQERRRQREHATLELLRSSLSELRAEVLPPPELERQLLLKLLVNCCANPLTALLHCRNGGLAPGNTHAEAVWRGVVAEFRAAFGARLPGSDEELLGQVERVVRATSANYNSMLQDVVARSPTEIEFLNGYVVRQAAAVGAPAPVNELLAALIRAREGVPEHLLTNESL